METGNDSLFDDYTFFETHKPEWVPEHQDQFALICNHVLDGFYETYESAYKAGLRAFGVKSFLVKQVCAVEPVFYIY
jgi:hypothetical protein